jgi:hypothetical protein
MQISVSGGGGGGGAGIPTRDRSMQSVKAIGLATASSFFQC